MRTRFQTLLGLLGWVGCVSFTLFSISAGAQSAVVPVQVAPNTYYVQGLSEIGSPANENFISNAGFVIAPQGVVVIDALGSPGLSRKFIAEIQKITSKPITYVILTHYHADHVYGLQSFTDLGAKVIAQTLGREYLTSDTAQQRLATSRVELAPSVNAQTRLVAADIWIDRDQTLELSGLSFMISQVGPAHTPDDLAIFVPSEGVLFAGDLVFKGRVPYVGTADSKGWIKSLDKLLTVQPRVIVPGHGAYSQDPSKDLVFTRDYLVYLRQSMQRAAQELEEFDLAYDATDWSAYQGVPLFRAANRMNAYNVYLSIQNE